MAVIYRWVQNEKGNQTHLLRIDGNVRTCFKADKSSQYKEEYELSLAEGNTPEPADPEPQE